jgi:hypothetical protein
LHPTAASDIESSQAIALFTNPEDEGVASAELAVRIAVDHPLLIWDSAAAHGARTSYGGRSSSAFADHFARGSRFRPTELPYETVQGLRANVQRLLSSPQPPFVFFADATPNHLDPIRAIRTNGYAGRIVSTSRITDYLPPSNLIDFRLTLPLPWPMQRAFSQARNGNMSSIPPELSSITAAAAYSALMLVDHARRSIDRLNVRTVRQHLFSLPEFTGFAGESPPPLGLIRFRDTQRWPHAILHLDLWSPADADI